MSSPLVIKTINVLLLVLVAVVPAVFWKHIMYPFIIPKTAIFEVLAELIIALWVGLMLADRRYRPRWNTLTVAVLVFVAVLTLASLLGADWEASVWSTPARGWGLFAWWHFTALLFALSCVGRKIRWRAVWWVSVSTSALIAVLTLLSRRVRALEIFFLNQGIDRPTGTFGNPTFLAGYLLLNVFIALMLFRSERKRRWRWAAAAAGVADVLGVFVSQTLGDIGGLLAGAAVFVLFAALQIRAANRAVPPSGAEGKRKNFWAWIFVGLCAAGFLAWAVRGTTIAKVIPGLSRLSNPSALEGDLAFRFYAWKAGLAAFQEKPLLGWGWENFNIAFQGHYNPKFLTSNFNETFWDKPHNLYVEYLVTAGVPGLLAFAGVAAALGAALLKRRDRASVPALLAFLAAYLVRSAAIFDTIGVSLMLLLVIACAAGEEEAKGSAGASGKNGRKEASPPPSSPLRFAPLLLAAAVAVPAYFVGVLPVHGMTAEYWGLNNYLAGQNDDSLASYTDALATPSPYRDYTALDFAGVVQSADQSGRVYQDMENLQKKAAAGVETLIADHPRYYFYYAFLAEFKNEFHRFDPNYLSDAKRLEAKALELSPNRQQVYYVIAKTQLWEGRVSDAYQTFEHVISLNPDAGDPHFYLGLLAFQQGDSKTGVTEVNRALALGRDVKTAEEAETLGTVIGDQTHDYHTAVLYYAKAFSLEKDPVKLNEIQLRLGLAYYYNGQKSEAEEAFRSLLKKASVRSSPAIRELVPILDSMGIPY